MLTLQQNCYLTEKVKGVNGYKPDDLFFGPLWNVKDLGQLRICNVGIITSFF